MRWFPYFILAYLAVGVQIGAGEFLRFYEAKPDLVLIAVVFIAINAPRESALLGCFLLGVLADLASGASLGLYALSYSLVAMLTVGMQEVLYREHPLTHVSVAFVGALMVAAVELVHGLVHGARLSPAVLFTSAVYTAALAPLILAVLQRLKRAFAFQVSRRRMRGAM